MEIGKSVKTLISHSIHNSISTVVFIPVNNSVDSLFSYWLWDTMSCMLYGNIINRVVI